MSEVGKGSTFTLTIDVGSPGGADGAPTSDAVAAAHVESLPRGPKPSRHSRLLLAEDDPGIQRIICLLLQKAGQEIDVAVDGQLACQMAEQSTAEGRPYDLILMDIQMPELDGYQATRRLRERGWRRPIVALTAHAMLGDREKCLAAGCDDYLAKPILMSGLQEVLNRHLGPTAVPTDQLPGRQRPAAESGGPLGGDFPAASMVEMFTGGASG
jgi:CheY-like chemotaxis protein